MALVFELTEFVKEVVETRSLAPLGELNKKQWVEVANEFKVPIQPRSSKTDLYNAIEDF